MGRILDLARRYESLLGVQWPRDVSGSERTWFVVYPPQDERRLRFRLDEFALATQRAGKRWVPVDLTAALARWMAENDMAEEYFAEPEFLTPELDYFAQDQAQLLRQVLESEEAGPDSVVALYGIASLYGALSTSQLLDSVADAIQGILLVMFPGTYEGNRYHLLEISEGWNYRAVPVIA